MNRWRDWWQQALRDVAHARHALDDGDHEWAAFAAQQASEKAVKALIQANGGEPWGHLTSGLLEALPVSTAAPETVLDAGRRLDKHYIPARYPNGLCVRVSGQAVHRRGGTTGDRRCRHDPRVLPEPSTSIRESDWPIFATR